MKIELNVKAKREILKQKPGLLLNLKKRCANNTEFIKIAEEIARAEKWGTKVNWMASDIDAAFTWYDTPQGSEFWANIHDKLEEAW
jgi:hypothetical protein